MSLTLKNINKAFGEKEVISNFSFDFPDKGIYAISGESGVGKTTLLRIISGIEKNFNGEVINGGPTQTAVCFQEHRLFKQLTAIENLTEVSFKCVLEDNARKARDLLLRLNFSKEEMTLYPDELSGGMKQRIAFARAVLREAPILILDEPTKELDAELVNTVLEIIRQEGERRLVLIVTHKLQEAEALGAKTIALVPIK